MFNNVLKSLLMVGLISLPMAMSASAAVSEEECRTRYYPHCNNRIYVGVDYVYSMQDIDQDSFGVRGPEEFSVGNIYVGYELSPHVGFELGYSRSTKETENNGSGAVALGYPETELEYQSIYLDVVPAYHIPKFPVDILGLIGVEYTMQSGEFVGANPLVDINEPDEDIWGLRYGVGLRTHLTPAFSLRGMYYRVEYFGEELEQTSDNFLIGAQYHFGTKY